MTTFGGSSPPLVPLAVDFNLRTDVHLGGSQVSDVLAVDLNGNGLLDLVEANYLDGTIRIGLRDPLGGISLSQVLTGGGGAVWRLAAGDLDGNGLVDIAAVEVSNPPGGFAGVTAFLQDTPGNFGATASTFLAGNAVDLAVIPAVSAPSGLTGAGDLLAVAESGLGRTVVMGWTGAQLDILQVLDTGLFGKGKPITVTTLDVAGDGLTDIAVGEIEVEGGAMDRVMLFQPDLGGVTYGTGVFIAQSSFPIIDAVGDVDGNGFDDIGVAQLTATTVQILLFDAFGLGGIGLIEFGEGTSAVAFGDFDSSGTPDAVVTTLDSQEVVVALAAPLAGDQFIFGAPFQLNAGFLPRSVSVADVSGDGNLDVLCASNSDVSILEGDGFGGFRAASGFSIGAQPVLVKCEDLDGDDDLDIIAVDITQRQFDFLENTDGNGTFVLVAEVPFEVPPTEELPGGFDVGDLNGDGKPDVALVLHALGLVHILWNDGDLASFGMEYSSTFDLGPGLYGVSLNDVNGDGLLDAVVSNSGDNSVRLLLNDPGQVGTLAEAAPIMLPFSPAAIAFGDFNGDELGDLAFTGLDGVTPMLGVLGGDGSGGFSMEASLVVDSLGSSLVSADLNDDGLSDLVAGQPALSFEDVWVYVASGDFAFTGTALTVGGSPGAVDVGDVDRDGSLDLILPSGEGELRIAFGDGEGGFPTLDPPGEGIWPVPNGTNYTCFADVTGDSLPDLVMVSPMTPDVWIGRNLSIEIGGQ